MEETLGKRIVSNRKRLGLTQDQLAEQLGVTAQAVSKWENDQSCPDISMLPRLADIFDITTDVLLGRSPQEAVHDAEIVTENQADPFCAEECHVYWNGRKGVGIGIATWILLLGAQLLAAYLLNWNVTFWELAWPTGLTVFGIFGLFPRFSFFRLGCALLGAFCILNSLDAAPFHLSKELLLPAFLLLFGLSLLIDSLGGAGTKKYAASRGGHIFTSGRDVQTDNHFLVRDDSFDCALTFGEDSHDIQLPRLAGGSATVSFGDLTIDLTGCGEITLGCPISTRCAFGALQFYVPKWCRVDLMSRKAFAAIDIKGTPDPNPKASISMDAHVSFGEISIRYI